jgi:hypothetical protein
MTDNPTFDPKTFSTPDAMHIIQEFPLLPAASLHLDI